MSFTELQNGLKEAMKARDTQRKEAIQTLIAAVKRLLLMQELVTTLQMNWSTALF